MPLPPLARRRFLLAISQLCLAGSLAGCSGEEVPAAGPAAAESDAALLAAVAFDLFPFPALAPALYVQIGERLQQGGNSALPEGLARLRSVAAGSAWQDVAEAQRLAVLTELQGTPFFGAVRATALEVLFRAPETFAMVGYGGSAIEQGGYVNRGFADIDWLPAAAAQQ